MTSGRDEYMEKRRPNYEELQEQFAAEFNKTGGAAHGGLTVRDYFAAKVMEAWIMSGYVEFGDSDHTSEAHQAYRVADAMLKERSK